MEMELLLHRVQLDSPRRSMDSSLRSLECLPSSPPVGPHQEGDGRLGQARSRRRSATGQRVWLYIRGTILVYKRWHTIGMGFVLAL
ncbi:hypothetical protein ZWY2020_040415 [Hordeum vulgare]|nr:hypothetical protein ZWY2020_040415 [Hordeum vulgare]